MAHGRNDIFASGSDEDIQTDEKQNLWLQILSEVQENSSHKLRSSNAVLVLGDIQSGKTSLIAKFQGIEDPKKGSGLEYHCVHVQDEYTEDQTHLSVWVLDGDPWHKNLLKFALKEENFSHTTVLLTAAMTQPWDILESLNMWATILEEHIGRLRIAKDVMDQHKRNVLNRFQDYNDFGDGIENITSLGSSCQSALDNKDGAVPLDNHTLSVNLGLDIIVVITKTDYMSTLEKDFDYKEEHFDFIQQAVRKFCLKYGAALFYTSVKEDKNCDLLFKYLVHRIYSFPFETSALVVGKDDIFIPAGWDNKKKISILYENLTAVSPEDPYSEVIVKPETRKPLQREAEVTCEEDQAFLARMQNLLNQQIPASVGRPVTANLQREAEVTCEEDQAFLARMQNLLNQQIPASVGRPVTAIEGNPNTGAGAGGGVLQNFFNTLRNRRTSSLLASPTGAIRAPVLDKTAVHHDAAAGLDRMIRTKKPTGPSPVLDPSVSVLDKTAVHHDAAAGLDRMITTKKPTGPSPVSDPSVSDETAVHHDAATGLDRKIRKKKPTGLSPISGPSVSDKTAVYHDAATGLDRKIRTQKPTGISPVSDTSVSGKTVVYHNGAAWLDRMKQMKKPTGLSPVSDPSVSDKTAVHHDAAAGLDRMITTKKPTGTSPVSDPSVSDKTAVHHDAAAGLDRMITKKPTGTSPVSDPSVSDKTAVHHDAAAGLDRMITTKKPTGQSPVSDPSVSDKTAVRHDAAAELDPMTQTKKPTGLSPILDPSTSDDDASKI